MWCLVDALVPYLDICHWNGNTHHVSSNKRCNNASAEILEQLVDKTLVGTGEVLVEETMNGYTVDYLLGDVPYGTPSPSRMPI